MSKRCDVSQWVRQGSTSTEAQEREQKATHRAPDPDEGMPTPVGLPLSCMYTAMSATCTLELALGQEAALMVVPELTTSFFCLSIIHAL